MGSQENTNLLGINITSGDGQRLTLGVSAVESLYFIEDVFSFCMTGKLKFVDYGNIMEIGNIWGYHNEKVTIVYGLNETEDIERDFLIYKINKQSPTSPDLNKDNVYEIILVSPLYYQWHFKQYSRSFVKMKIGDMLNHIMTKMVGGTFYQKESANEKLENFYTGLKSPAENFKYLMERATGVETGKPGFVCFENLDGYNLVTLSKLMNNTVAVMKPDEMDNKKYSFFTDNTFLHNKVISFERYGVDNGSMQQLSGGYRMGYDILRKKNIVQKYTYQKSRGEFLDNILGSSEYPLLDPSITGQERYLKTGEDNENIIDNIYYNNWIKQYSMQQIFSVYVRGHEKRKAGGMIKIEWPAGQNGKMNENFNGKFFVKSVVHYFYKNQQPYYNQKLVLMKNAYDGKNLL